MERPARDGDEATLAERLRRLKRHGCVLLVTGDVDAEVRAEATRRLLGGALERRTRVLVLTDPAVGAVADRLPTGVSPADDGVRVIDRRELGGSPGDVPPSGDAPPLDPLRALRDAALGELEAIDHAALGEGELRFALDSLGSLNSLVPSAPSGSSYPPDSFDPSDSSGLPHSPDPSESPAPPDLLDAPDSPASTDRLDTPGSSAPRPVLPTGALGEGVIRLLRLLTAIVRGARGLGHVHYPIDDGDERVEAVAPLFDARLELRRRGTLGPEQRWHLSADDASEWVRI